MKIINTIFLLSILSLTTYLVSCSDDSVSAEQDNAQIREDSVAQSKIDNDSIDWYIQSQNIPLESINIDSTTGVRYAILKNGNGITPNLNAIISINLAGNFLNGIKFDVSSEREAILSDSLNYVEMGISFDNLLSKSNLSFEQLLDSLSISEGKIKIPLYSSSIIYQPLVFNYTQDGRGISSSTRGYAVGLSNLLNLTDNQGNLLFGLGGKSIIFIPSAVGYGVFGDIANPDIEDNFPPNTVLVYEFTMVNIRN